MTDLVRIAKFYAFSYPLGVQATDIQLSPQRSARYSSVQRANALGTGLSVSSHDHSEHHNPKQIVTIVPLIKTGREIRTSLENSNADGSNSNVSK